MSYMQMRMISLFCLIIAATGGLYALVGNSGMFDWNVVTVTRADSITELTDRDAVKVARAVTDSVGKVKRDPDIERKLDYVLTTDHSLFKGISIGRDVKTFNVYVSEDRIELFEKSVGIHVMYTSFEKGTKPYEILKMWGT